MYSPHHLPQFCDFDLCDACCELQFSVAFPPVPKFPSPHVSLAMASPLCSAVDAPIQSPVRSPVRDVAVICISSDDSPLFQRIHPFFIRREPQGQLAAAETHELGFHALAREPAPPGSSPHRRVPGRLKLRVSRPVLPTPFADNSPTSTRVVQSFDAIGPSNHVPELICPQLIGENFDSADLVADNSRTSPRVVQSFDAISSPQDVPAYTCPHLIGDRCDSSAQTDPQPDIVVLPSPQALTLQHFQNEMQVLRNELRTLVMGFGF